MLTPRYASRHDMSLSRRNRNLYHIEIFSENYIEFVIRQIYPVGFSQHIDKTRNLRRLAAEDSNPARSAFVKNASFLIVKLEGRQPIFAFRTKNLQFFANGEFEEVFAINSKQNKEKAQVIRRCIAEHFDEVLRRICRKNRTWFESSTANRRKIIRT